jgi:hypothetical protein
MNPFGAGLSCTQSVSYSQLYRHVQVKKLVVVCCSSLDQCLLTLQTCSIGQLSLGMCGPGGLRRKDFGPGAQSLTWPLPEMPSYDLLLKVVVLHSCLRGTHLPILTAAVTHATTEAGGVAGRSRAAHSVAHMGVLHGGQRQALVLSPSSSTNTDRWPCLKF